nr:hypothetical protein [Tanacetum cinerariifolium]
ALTNTLTSSNSNSIKKAFNPNRVLDFPWEELSLTMFGLCMLGGIESVCKMNLLCPPYTLSKEERLDVFEGKKDKNRDFVVNLKHNGMFSPYPFSYMYGDEKQLTDFDFEGMSYDNLRELVGKLVHVLVSSLYYCKVEKTLKQGLCPLENDADVQEFLKAGYESKWVVDLYVEHHRYDPMDYKNSNARDYESSNSSDAYSSSDDEHVIDYVDFYHEGEHDVVVKNITTNDPFLTKLYGNNGNFRGFINEPIPGNEDLHIEDIDSSSLEPKHQIQMGIAYPRHDPLQPWNEMQPILGMRDMSTGRCVGYLSKKVKAKKQLFTESHDDANKGTSKYGEGSSRNSDVSLEWTKSKIAFGRKSGQPQCGFRLWGSWMKDLELGHGTGITVISDSHKLAAGTTVESIFYNNMDQIKAISIKPIYSSNIWKKQPNKPLLPPIVVRMPGRPRKNRVKAKSENNSQPDRKREPNFNSYASNRGGGRGSRGGRGQESGGMGDASGGRGQESSGLGEASGALGEVSDGVGQLNAARFQANTKRGESSSGRNRATGRGGRNGRARGREEARYEKEYQDKIREDEEYEYNQIWYNHGITPSKSANTREEYGTAYVQTQESILDRAQPSVAATETTPKGKTIKADAAEPPKLKKQGRKRKMVDPSAAELQFRIYHKNRGRSERIFNQKMKKTGFGPNGEGSTADKAFSL